MSSCCTRAFASSPRRPGEAVLRFGLSGYQIEGLRPIIVIFRTQIRTIIERVSILHFDGTGEKIYFGS